MEHPLKHSLFQHTEFFSFSLIQSLVLTIPIVSAYKYKITILYVFILISPIKLREKILKGQKTRLNCGNEKL